MIARSNMNIIKTETIDENNVMDIFEPSVPMSTYLVAFLVADFGSTANENDETYKIWHQKSKAAQAKYAASIGEVLIFLKLLLTIPTLIPTYNSNFNSHFQLPK